MASYPTLKDVSAAAGVSMALVSVVLNGKKSRIMASAATRERIFRAAAELGYEPDRNARGLRMSRSFLIGVLAYEISSSFVPEIVTGIEQAFLHTNYNILLGSYHSESEFKERLEMFRKRKVDALIIICSASRILQEMPSGLANVPKVLVGCELDLPDTACVFSDRRAIGNLAARSIYERGHRRAGYLINCNCDDSGWREQWSKYSDAAEPVQVECRNYFDEGEAAVRKLLTEHPDISAVFADSDILAAAAVKCAIAMGRKVPDDLAVLGTDDSAVCQLTSPALSSIRQLKRERGDIAARMVLDMLENKKCANIALPGELILRESL